MKNYYNIENNKNLDGSRTAYDAAGRSWRIKGVSGNWRAVANTTKQGSLNVIYGCDTLKEISEKLEKIK